MKRLLSFSIALALVGSTRADSMSFTSVADTTIFTNSSLTVPRDSSGQPLSSATTMIVGQINAGNTCRDLVRFNIAALPTNATITAVTLEIEIAKAHLPTADTLTIQRLTAPWTEAGATWSTSGVAAWSGGTFSATADSQVIAGGIGPTAFASTAAMIATVQTWRTNSASNNGWIIRNSDEVSSSNARRLLTRESASGQPTLTIEYTLPPAPLALLNPRVQDSQFAFDFRARAGHTYTVEFKEDLNVTNWMTFQDFADPGVDSTNTVLSDFATQQFFRVLEH
jgi:hypothetical protein